MSTKFLDRFRPEMAEYPAGNTEQAMKSVLRIYLNPNAIDGLAALINQAATVTASEHEVFTMSVRLLLQNHEVLRRFSDEELKMGNLTYRCPVWIENDDADVDILGNYGIRLDRRIPCNADLISFFAVRHYFNVPTGRTVKLGHAIPSGPSRSDEHVAWIVSYDPTRDNPFRYRLDIEGKDLAVLFMVALKVVACETVA